jgi:hypothetical protein
MFVLLLEYVPAKDMVNAMNVIQTTGPESLV